MKKWINPFIKHQITIIAHELIRGLYGGKWINPFKYCRVLSIAHGLNRGLWKCEEQHKTVSTV